jgi:hypothetical protein
MQGARGKYIEMPILGCLHSSTPHEQTGRERSAESSLANGHGHTHAASCNDATTYIRARER